MKSFRRLSNWICFTLIGLLSACGSKETPPPEPPPAKVDTAPYFRTHFQDESQYIVETILADIAEMAFYAKQGTLPNSNHFQVAAMETGNSTFRRPVYDCKITFAENQPALTFALPVDGPIWSPVLFSNATASIFGFLGIEKEKGSSATDVGSLLMELTDAQSFTIERLSQVVSSELHENFRDSALHEKAAVILGAFALQEASGQFCDLHSTLSRITAHLAFANALAGGAERTITGQIAEIVLFTGMGNQKDALHRIEKLKADDKHSTIWRRVLFAKNTADYRALTELRNPTPLERIAWFGAYSTSSSVAASWQSLKKQDLANVNLYRMANEIGSSVEVGHTLFRSSLSLESKAFKEIYENWHGEALEEGIYAHKLNTVPERCFSTGADGKTKVRVIGWGQWAGFFQRHLFHAVRENHLFLKSKLGVREEAQEFLETWKPKVADLRLYPVLHRMQAADEEDCRKAVNALLDLTRQTPHLVAPQGWNYLLWNTFPQVTPNQSETHINEWHKHNPPPGTAYNFYPRTDHPSLINRQDKAAVIEELHGIAPYSKIIARSLIFMKYGTNATYEQLSEIYGPLLDYSAAPIASSAALAKDRPEIYESLMLKASKLQPSRYIDLAQYFFERSNETKAVFYTEKRIEMDPDAVGVANKLGWIINYYLDHGNTNRAEELANFGGDVYSLNGLESKAWFLERTGNHQEAFEWYKKIEERYNRSEYLINFCMRYRTATGEAPYRAELKTRLDKVFPTGLKKVALSDFRAPIPKKAVLINEDNDLLRNAGLKKGDIIVALNGIQVSSMLQYTYLREDSGSNLNLIVWNGDVFREVKASPPNGRFNADFRDYTRK